MPCPICSQVAEFEIYQTHDISTLPPSTSSPVVSASSKWPQIGEHLASLTRDFFQAINDRGLSSASPPWTATKNFRAIPEIANRDGQSEYDLEGHLVALRSLCQMHPRMQVDITDMVVHIHKRTLCAEVFAGHNTSGTEPSVEGTEPVVWQSMGVMEFHFEEGRWLLSRFRAMGGLAMFGE